MAGQWGHAQRWTMLGGRGRRRPPVATATPNQLEKPMTPERRVDLALGGLSVLTQDRRGIQPPGPPNRCNRGEHDCERERRDDHDDC